MAPGTGDGDFSLAPGHPNHLAAFGAVKIAVLPILQPTGELQKLPVFLIALIGVPGQTAPDRPNHQPVAQHKQQQIHRRVPDKHRQQTCGQTRAKNHHIQLIRSVASRHKPAQARTQPCGKLPEPTANAVHKKITFAKKLNLEHIILQSRQNATRYGESLRIV